MVSIRVTRPAILIRQVLAELHMPHAVSAVQPLLSRMPKYKRDHSIRTASLLNNVGSDDHVWAALVHDYLERGGKLSELSSHIERLGLSPRVLRIVRALSSDKADPGDGSNAVLSHLQHVIPTLDQEDANAVALIKLSDRIDNLRKRIRRDGRVGKNYRRKSREVLEYLRSVYTGPKEWFEPLAQKIVNLTM